MSKYIVKSCPYCGNDYRKEYGVKGFCSLICYKSARIKQQTSQAVELLMEFKDVTRISHKIKLPTADVIRIAKRYKLIYFEKQAGDSYLLNEMGNPVARDQFEIIRLMIEKRLLCPINKNKLDAARKEWVKIDTQMMMALEQTMVPCRQCRDDVWWACSEYGLTCSLFENWSTTNIVRQAHIKRHNERVNNAKL